VSYAFGFPPEHHVVLTNLSATSDAVASELGFDLQGRRVAQAVASGVRAASVIAVLVLFVAAETGV
jgi:hypothetical protein